MATPALRQARYEDLFDLPDNVTGEIIDGVVHVSPRPAMPHAHISSILGMDIGGPFDRGRGGPGGWWIIDEPELHLGPDVLVPDLAGWRRERMPVVPSVPWVELAPDWVCEVLSPSTAAIDRAKKLPRYAQAGVRWMWMVDPILRTVEVLDLSGDAWTLVAVHEGDEAVRLPPFDAIELDLASVWPPKPPESA